MSQRATTYEFKALEEPLSVQLGLLRNSVFSKSEEQQQTLLNTLAFDENGYDPARVIYVEGRNYFLDLGEEGIGIYDTLQISGAGFIATPRLKNLGNGLVMVAAQEGIQTIQPPKKYAPGDKLYEHYTDYYNAGKPEWTEGKVDYSPLGGYQHDLAARKWNHMRRAQELFIDTNVLVPFCQAYVDYPDITDQNGQPQRGILSLVPNRGNRLAADLTLISAFANEEEGAIKYYMRALSKKMYASGLAASVIHEAGLVHNQLTAGNIEPSFNNVQGEPVIFVADWETPSEIRPEDEKGMRAFDLMKMVRSITSVAVAVAEQGSKSFWYTLAAQQAADIICGYNQTNYLAQTSEDMLERIGQIITGSSRLGIEATASFLE